MALPSSVKRRMRENAQRKIDAEQLAFETEQQRKIDEHNEIRNIKIFGTNQTRYQIDLEKTVVKPTNCTTSKKFDRSEIDVIDDDYYVNGKFVPSTQIVERHYGAAMVQKTYMFDETAKPFKRQSDRIRTKNSHLNESFRCRGAISVSGGHVENEFTTSVHNAIEIEIDTI